MTLLRSLAFVAVLLGAAVAASADDAFQLPAGAKVRVSIADRTGPVTGTLLALDDRTLTLQIPGQRAPAVFRRDAVTAVAVSSGRRARRRGTGLGAALGAVTGLGIGAASGNDSRDQFLELPPKAKMLVGVVGGAWIGALLGAAVSPAERWDDVPLERARFSIHPARGRGLGVSVAFAF